MSVIKPKIGQVWAYGGRGKPQTVTRVKRGRCGVWQIWNGKLQRMPGPATTMYVRLDDDALSIPVQALWRKWKCLSEKLGAKTPTPATA